MSLGGQGSGDNPWGGKKNCAICSSSIGLACLYCKNCGHLQFGEPQTFEFTNFNNPGVVPASDPGRPQAPQESGSFLDRQPRPEESHEAASKLQQQDQSRFGIPPGYGGVSEQVRGYPPTSSDNRIVGNRLQNPSSIGQNVYDAPPGQQHTTLAYTPVVTLPSISASNFGYPENIPLLSPAFGARLLQSGFSPEEVDLMRHFILSLSPWFDACNHKRHFGMTVPQYALDSLVLRNAIFATSAGHLSRISNYEPSVSVRYYQKCQDDLIPMVTKNGLRMDMALLAATVILSLLKELEAAPPEESKNLDHLSAIRSLIGTSNHLDLTGAQQAAFLVAARQEMLEAFIAPRAPMQPSLYLRNCFENSTDEDSWAFRILFHCSEVLYFTFGPDRGSRSELRKRGWSSLMEYSLKWLAERPPSFGPKYQNNSAENVFPEAVFNTRIHAFAALHYHMSIILLRMYNPSLLFPTPPASLFSGLLTRENTIRNYVKIMCGCTIIHDSFAAGAIISSAVIARCAEFFTRSSEREQKALLGVLEMTETRHGWPTADAQRSVKGVWGWRDETRN